MEKIVTYLPVGLEALRLGLEAALVIVAVTPTEKDDNVVKRMINVLATLRLVIRK